MSSVDSFNSSTAATAGGDLPLPGRGPDASLVQEMKHEIRNLVQEIAQLAQADISEDEFYSGALNRIVSAMAAVGGAVWTLDANGFSLQYQVNLAQVGLNGSEVARTQHQRLLERVAESQQALLVPPRSGPPGETEAANPTELLLVIAPLLFEGQVHGVVEIFQRPGGGPTTQRGYLRFLAQMADLAADFLKNSRLRQLKDRQQIWQQLEHFLQSIHGSLDLRQTSYAVVNEARRLLGCDRVSLALCHGRSRATIEAVSGLDTIERRAAQIRQLQDLSRAVLKTGQPFWHEADGEEAPPQIEAPLQQYVDLSHARMLGILPLYAPAPKRDPESTTAQNGAVAKGRLIGALIIEQLREDRASASLRSRVDTVAQHAATALANSDRYSSLFLLPLWQALGRATRLLRGWALLRTLIIAALLVGGGVSLAVVQQDFEVAARGKLQPAERREVFAGIDGIVAQVPVRHGQLVEPGQVLTELQNNDLEQQLASLLGRQNTNQEQIAALQRALLDTSSSNTLAPGEENRMAGQMLELRQEAENLQRELELFRARQQQLTVVAEQPGQVITWKVDELLLRRPVQRGQVLMTIANPHGPWELELYVPERRMKHLAAAVQLPIEEGQRPPLEVVFMLSSHPGEEFHGRIVEIEQTTEVRGEDGNTVLVRVEIDKNSLPPLHDQVTVTGRIYCGKASVGYAWFCDLIEAAQAKVLFWL